MVSHPYTIQNHTVVPPYGFDLALRGKIAEVVKRFLPAIGLKNEVAHTEIKVVQDGQPFIIGLRLRWAGTEFGGVELTTGVKQIDLALKNLVEPITVQDFPDAHAMAAFFRLLPLPEKSRPFPISSVLFKSRRIGIHL